MSKAHITIAELVNESFKGKLRDALKIYYFYAGKPKITKHRKADGTVYYYCMTSQSSGLGATALSAYKSWMRHSILCFSYGPYNSKDKDALTRLGKRLSFVINNIRDYGEHQNDLPSLF